MEKKGAQTNQKDQEAQTNQGAKAHVCPLGKLPYRFTFVSVTDTRKKLPICTHGAPPHELLCTTAYTTAARAPWFPGPGTAAPLDPPQGRACIQHSVFEYKAEEPLPKHASLLFCSFVLFLIVPDVTNLWLTLLQKILLRML